MWPANSVEKEMPMRLYPLTLAAALALALGSPYNLARAAAPTDQQLSQDGLQKAKSSGVDKLYVRPGATLAPYKRVKLDEVAVTFPKNWEPARPGTRINLSDGEMEELRRSISKLVRDEFVRQFESKGGYKVVDEIGPDVLHVKAQAVDVTLAAVETPENPFAQVYARNAGQMTLVAELSDSQSGQVLARSVDSREGRDLGRLVRISAQESRAQFEYMAADWVAALVKSLKAAQDTAMK
jgi:hypothetical protein